MLAATLQGPALTWWNAKVAIMGLVTMNQMPWTKMEQLMTAEFYPIEEVQRMEHELWNLKVKECNIVAHTSMFNELALMCPRMVELERVKVDAYIRGLTENIKGEVTSSKPANLNEAVRMAHKLMEQKSSSAKVWKGYWDKARDIFGHTDAQRRLSKRKLGGRAYAIKDAEAQGAEPVARAPYRLTPSEMRELSVQMQELLEK
ncbi:putative reverse transcriptase domain-containing protein [Tanacetum coccineum]